MSILIKGMEIPKRCEECKMCLAMGLKSPPLCALTGSRILGFANPKLDNCPLVEVVHCKDCVKHTAEEPGMVYCPHIVGGWCDDDWFCKSGERKEET